MDPWLDAFSNLEIKLLTGLKNLIILYEDPSLANPWSVSKVDMKDVAKEFFTLRLNRM